MDLILPNGFCDRAEDRRFFVQLSLLGIKDKRIQQWYAYRVWQDYASAGGKDRVLEGYTFVEELKGEPLAKSLEGVREVMIIELFVDWGGELGMFVASAIEAGFLKLRNRSDGVVLLDCVGFYPLNNEKNSMQKKGGYAKAVSSRRKQAAKDAQDSFMYCNSAEGMQTSGLSDDDRAKVIECLATLARCTNRASLNVKDYTNSLVMAVHRLLGLCDKERLDALYLKVYGHKDEWVEAERLDLLVVKLTGMVTSGEM